MNHRFVKHRFVTLFLSATLVFGAAACSSAGQAASALVGIAEAAPVASTQAPAATVAQTVVEYDAADTNVVAASAGTAPTTTIKLNGGSISVTGSGATAKDSVVTITAAGRYAISGKLNDGQIVVDTKDAQNVVLELNGVDITNTWGAPIYVANAEKVVLTLADGTQNTVTDGAAYKYADAQTTEPDAAIFSHDDLTINGTGALTVNANYKDGITGKDDLKITGGTITVTAADDGIKGRDSLAIKDGTITVDAGGDGLRASNDGTAEADAAGSAAEEVGWVVIDGGTLNITAGNDGIQAESKLEINAGDITVDAGGGSQAGKDGAAGESGKGLKAGSDILVLGGVVDVDSGDDALNANNSVTVGGGDLTIATGDDGIRANVAFTLDGGEVNIARSYEGVESETITINAGELRLVSQDDGINGTDSTAAASGGQGGFGGPGAATGNSHLVINGGYVAVDAGGDGIDINGPIDMTGGTVLVNGPTANNNGALDYGGSFNITGGFLVAAGSAGMAEAPSTSSTQYSLAQAFSSPLAAGTLVRIQSQDGKEIVTFAPTKTFQSIVVSSPDLVKGGTYVVYAGGNSSGTVQDSVVTGGTYSGGQQVASYTLNSVVTGTAGGGMGPGGMGRGRRP